MGVGAKNLLVSGPVQLGAYVVALASIGRNVGTDFRNVLDRADCIHGHARRPRDGAAGLDHQPGHLQITSRAAGLERVTNGLDELAWSGRVVVTRVRDSEATACTELARLEVQLVPQQDQKRD